MFMMDIRPSAGKGTPAVPAVSSFGHADAVLHQIRHALGVLLATGEETVIDLDGLPFGPGDLACLEGVLGDGEVDAAIDAGGRSQVRETGVHGVWRVDHLDQVGTVQARFVEVAFVPALLRAQREDVETGLAALNARLSDR